MIFVNYIRCKVVLTELVIVILLFFPAYSAAGTNDINNRLLTESGIITGYGKGDVKEGNYEPVLLIWHLGCDLKRFIPELKSKYLPAEPVAL